MSQWRSRQVKRISKVVLCLLLPLFLLFSCRHLGFGARRYNSWNWQGCSGVSPFDQLCTSPGGLVAKESLVVVKTGGSESKTRLRAQLATVLSHIPAENLIIFSDMEEEVNGYPVHDVYANISIDERAEYPEFALYDAQQEYQSQEKDITLLRGGWEMAKYMNLAMKRKLWAMQGHWGHNYQWFAFIDTDTFVDLDNLFELLSHFEPADEIYMGSPVWLPGLEFAHGGSAYVLSYGALEALNKRSSEEKKSPLRYSQYGFNTTALCCGDEALARVLKSKGVNLQGYWPMFNGEAPETLSFGREFWCEPVVSLHHLAGEEMQRLWRWIEEWKIQSNSKRPLLFKDLFNYVASQIPVTGAVMDWDNTDADMKIYPRDRIAHTSFGNCGSACEEDRLCFQFVYDGIACALSHRIRLGQNRLLEGPGAKRYISGWNVERIREWTMNHDCASAHWVVSNP